jgi:hypothetical protein
MSHEENFRGDQLRLISFLRVVDNVPQRPCRFRRKALAFTGQPAPFQAEPPHFTNHTDQNHTAEPCAVLPISYPPSHVPTAHNSIDCRSSDEEEQPDSAIVVEQDDDWHSTVVPKRKKLAVFRPKAKRTNSPVTMARITRNIQLPVHVNELALVRTTTANGLPDRDVGRQS